MQWVGYRSAYRPDQPRAPRGSPGGGQWVGDNSLSAARGNGKLVFTSLEKPPSLGEVEAKLKAAREAGVVAVFDFDLKQPGGAEAASAIKAGGGFVVAYHVGGGGGRAWGSVGAGEGVRAFRSAEELAGLTTEVRELVALGADAVHFDNTHRMSGKTLEAVASAIADGGAGFVAKNNADKWDLVMRRRPDLVPVYAVIENAMHDADETEAASRLAGRGVPVYIVGFQTAIGKNRRDDVSAEYASEYARTNPWANVLLFEDERAYEGRSSKMWWRNNYSPDQPRAPKGTSEGGRWIGKEATFTDRSRARDWESGPVVPYGAVGGSLKSPLPGFASGRDVVEKSDVNVEVSGKFMDAMNRFYAEKIPKDQWIEGAKYSYETYHNLGVLLERMDQAALTYGERSAEYAKAERAWKNYGEVHRNSINVKAPWEEFSMKLKEVLPDPDLYEAYAGVKMGGVSLGDIPVKVNNPTMLSSTYGAYSDNRGGKGPSISIVFDNADYEKMSPDEKYEWVRGVLLHERQHAIDYYDKRSPFEFGADSVKVRGRMTTDEIRTSPATELGVIDGRNDRYRSQFDWSGPRPKWFIDNVERGRARRRNNYSPDQPRAPRGTPEGGRWVGKEATFIDRSKVTDEWVRANNMYELHYGMGGRKVVELSDADAVVDKRIIAALRSGKEITLPLKEALRHPNLYAIYGAHAQNGAFLGDIPVTVGYVPKDVAGVYYYKLEGYPRGVIILNSAAFEDDLTSPKEHFMNYVRGTLIHEVQHAIDVHDGRHPYESSADTVMIRSKMKQPELNARPPVSLEHLLPQNDGYSPVRDKWFSNVTSNVKARGGK